MLTVSHPKHSIDLAKIKTHLVRNSNELLPFISVEKNKKRNNGNFSFSSNASKRDAILITLLIFRVFMLLNYVP
jgi:hypothetical protein